MHDDGLTNVVQATAGLRGGSMSNAFGSPRLCTSVRPCPARTVHRIGILLALVLVGRSPCLAQSNDVYSFFTSAATPLTGYRVAVVSTSPIWVVGSPQNRFGVEECTYWTDSVGSAIPWPATRVKQPGDKQHFYTRLCFGQVSVSIPLSPLGFALVLGFGLLALASIPIRRFARSHNTNQR